jgi:serine/threonine protein phosphatase PrpC
VQNPTFLLESFGISDIGLVREHNEDLWAAYPEEGLFVLADGMGGHSCGEVAAKEALGTLYRLFKKWHSPNSNSINEAKHFFKEAFSRVNSLIHDEGEKSDELRGMGTTLCSLFFLGHFAILTHVGDSRIYVLRGKKLTQLTEDHSLVSELVSLGAMKHEEAETFPYKHILTRAIGTHAKVESTIKSIEVESGDLYMLCSDGLTNYAAHQQMEDILTSDASLAQKAQALVGLAIGHGGGDNITLILVGAAKNHDLFRQ